MSGKTSCFHNSFKNNYTEKDRQRSPPWPETVELEVTQPPFVLIALAFGMVLVQRRGDLLPLLELVLDGHHEAVEHGAAKNDRMRQTQG